MGFLAGAGFLIVGLFLGLSSLNVRRDWTETQGTITHLDFKKERIEYEYTVADRSYTGTSGDDPNWNRVGKNIRIFYDPVTPSISRHLSWSNEVVFGWIFTAAGFFVLLIELLA